MCYIKEIFLNSSDFDDYTFENKCIKNLSKINIFIGSNNSGKSRFIRKLFYADTLLFKPHNLDIDSINNNINDLKNKIVNLISSLNIADYGNIVKTIESVNLIEEYIQTEDNYLSSLKEAINILKSTHEDMSVTLNKQYHTQIDKKRLAHDIKDIGNKYEDIFNELINKEVYKFHKVYIPTLRGLRPLGDEDNYEQRTIKDYFNPKNNLNIFTGLSLYEEIKRLLLGNLKERNLIAEFQDFLSNNFFNGQELALIPSLKFDVLNVKIGKEAEQPIYNLGDGIQSIIILTFPLFVNRDKNLLLFIEEPEIFLHPGLQRKLLETFTQNEFNNSQFFISTHSNHLLDLTLDYENISIYSFKKELDKSDDIEKKAHFLVENINNPDNNILAMIGAK